MRKILRFSAYGLLGLMGLVVVAVGVVFAVSEARMRRTYAPPPAAVAIRNDAETVARGRHIAITRGCVDCHGEDFGGTIMADDPAIGRLSASNLTRGRGGVAERYSDAQWVTAIRHGVRPDGRPLIFMPSHEFYPLGDEDVGALVAFLKSLEPVDREQPDLRIGPLARALYLAGQMPLVPAEMIDHDGVRPAAPVAATTAEYGEYLATGCTGCHGPAYSGGKIPGAPPDFPFVANITPDPETGIGSWTEADFFRAMREGKRPDGSDLDPFMPWKYLRQMTDDEIRAIWLYLQTVPARAEGNR